MWAGLKKVWLRVHLWIAVIVALLGFAYYISQALAFADTLPPHPQEGINLFNGYQFADGRYKPYEDYSPYLSQMPLAYLLPGLVQRWFGSGMYVGRMYAVAVGALALFGLWLAVRRNANNWWAAFAVWAIVLNPTYVQMLSQATTTALVSMLIAWILVFGLGAERQDRELAVAAFFAGLAGITQQYLLLVLPLFVLYVFWQFDKRAGLLVLLVGLLPVIAVHIAYWPGILRIWADILPQELFAWTEVYRAPKAEAFLPSAFSWWPIDSWIRDRQNLAWVGLRSLGEAVRVNFVVFFGLLTTLFLWPWGRKNRPGGRSITKVFFNQHKQVVFLLVTFLVLFFVQLWASNGRTCQFTCLPENILGFIIFGIVLVPVAASGWHEEIPYWKQVLAFIAVALLLIALEFNYNSDYYDFRNDLVRKTLEFKVPKWQDNKLVQGTDKFWQVLEEKTRYDHASVRGFIINNDLAVQLVRWIKVLGFLILVIPLTYALSEKYMLGSENFGTFMLTFILLVGLLSSGSNFIGGFMAKDTCSKSVITSYDDNGKKLNAIIPDGSQLYWGTDDLMPLLYLSDVVLFTPQLNGSYTYLDDATSDSEWLWRFGWWNSVLRDEWLAEAEFVLLEKEDYETFWSEQLQEGQFEVVFTSQSIAGCRSDLSRIVVLQPVP